MQNIIPPDAINDVEIDLKKDLFIQNHNGYSFSFLQTPAVLMAIIMVKKDLIEVPIYLPFQLRGILEPVSLNCYSLSNPHSEVKIHFQPWWFEIPAPTEWKLINIHFTFYQRCP